MLKIKKKEKKKKTIIYYIGISQILVILYITIFLNKKSYIRLNSGTYKKNEIFGMVARKKSKNHSHN